MEQKSIKFSEIHFAETEEIEKNLTRYILHLKNEEIHMDNEEILKQIETLNKNVK